MQRSQRGRTARCAYYKRGAESIKFAEGSFTSATVTVTPVAGTAAKFVLAASTLIPVAGSSVNLTITALDAYANTATAYAGSKDIIFSGAATSHGGTAPTVVNGAGAAVAFGGATAITFTSGVAGVASAKNGVFKPTRAEAAARSATDGTISAASSPALTVSPSTATKLAFIALIASAGTVSPTCLFTCTVTGLGNSGTVTGGVAVTDTYGNVNSNIGTGHNAAVTVTGGGAIASGTFTFPSTGLAESPVGFTYTAPSSGAFTAAIKAAATAGTAYTNATATATK